ncbi:MULTISPECIES: hypothetical protein [unclassified Spirosoma]|uniref:hypothetical protein n=1 Tax=unclassified Spirosoma TaxID=2621999 RepID=UPI000960B925|nr:MULTISPECIES: hypothetical protein [unclassified Spirosoma]MBN8824448.1 hypothetical protein [Spirosoma sp.]OJW70089.1 MAG: hypothetical protein BGO59_25785 [Spirosoma sp. 48-14]
MKKLIRISSVDQTGGRVLIAAPGVVDKTGVSLFLNGEAEAWGKGEIISGEAHIVGRSSLPATYSLTMEIHTVNPKLLTSE